MYHGTPEFRAELRATRLQAPSGSGVGNVRNTKGKLAGNVNGKNTTASFPIVVTTYDICMKDQRYLSGFQWKVSDLDCTLDKVPLMSCSLLLSTKDTD